MSAKTVKSRRALGLCPRCGDTPEPGKSTCRSCLDKRSGEHKRNADRWRAQGLCTQCGKNSPPGGKLQCAECRERARTNRAGRPASVTGRVGNVRYRIQLRRDAFAAYGGKCACCGEDTWQFLGLDHINNDGRAHRLAISNGKASYLFYLRIKQAGYPSGIQVLCANCHRAKTVYQTCPHKE